MGRSAAGASGGSAAQEGTHTMQSIAVVLLRAPGRTGRLIEKERERRRERTKEREREEEHR